MSSWLHDIEPSVIGLVVDGLEALAETAAHKLRGDSGDADGKQIAADLKRRALAAAVDAIETGARHHAVMLGLEHKLDDMQTAAADVLNAFTVKGDIPNILEGADVQVMPDSWHPDPEPIAPVNTDDIVTKPGNG